MKARLVIEIDAREVNPRLPESMQMRDLCAHVLNLLGFGPPRPPGHPIIENAKITEDKCLSSQRRATPVEGAVIRATEEITRKIVMPEHARKTVVDPAPPAKAPPSGKNGNGNGKKGR